MTWDVWMKLSPHVCKRCTPLEGACWPTGEPHVMPPQHPGCMCLITVADEPTAKRGPKLSDKGLGAVQLWTEPVAASLATAWIGGESVALDDARRVALRAQLAAGQLGRLEFEAVTFAARYPNRNYVRFRDEDLSGFAASYVGAPFLRDHDVRHIEARGGTVLASRRQGDEFVQRIALTVPRDIEAFLNGQMDRFSISWHPGMVACGVCGRTWLSETCAHWPGTLYDGKLCELVFVEPIGKEVSAVNAPAVSGTGVRGVLAELMAAKQELWEGRHMANDQALAPAVSAVGSDDEALRGALRESLVDARLAASGLPVEVQKAVRQDWHLRAWTVAELDANIASQKTVWAAMLAASVVQGVGTPRDGRITGMFTGLDQITEALGALIDGVRPARARPLSGLREAYIAFSGDYELTGKFYGDRVSLASVDSTSMANIVADLLNKRVVNSFQRYPRWWEGFTRQEDFNTLQTVQWITLGGIGALPTVAEGAAYTELAWDDSKETATWAKKGGYVGITLEAMDKDDVSRLRSAPQALAQAAYLTLGKAVSGIFTSAAGLGPTLTDTGTLFNATAVSTPGGHANLGTAALSSASWTAAKLAMRKQAELGSGERLGGLVVPKFLLVPPDLEGTGLTMLASEGLPGTGNNDVNTEAEGNSFDARMASARRRLTVMDFWTDTNNWAAVADPMLYPTIGIGYRYGRAPEIFSVASETSGLMFTNDVMPIKVRWFYAVGPQDFRGLYKANVAGG